MITTGTYDNMYNTTVCLLYSPLFKQHFKLVATYLSKQRALDTDWKEIQ